MHESSGTQLADLLFVAMLLAGCGVWEVAPKPHVFLVIWDTTRPDHLTPYGYERDTTPNLARIAEQAAVFEQVVSPAPWTIPAVASIFTGLYVHNHKVSFEADNYAPILPAQATTMAEALRREGYATALYTQQAIFLENDSYCQGFDDCRTAWEDDLVAESVRFVDAAQGQPTFVVSYWLDPHAPYSPPDAADLWHEPGSPSVNLAMEADEPGVYSPRDVNFGKVVLDESQYRQLMAQYDGEIRANDSELGDYWSELEKRGLADEAIFIFVSDHGEAFGEHAYQRVWHGLPFETILQVPLIVRYPPAIRPGRYDALVSSIDILPTLLDLLDTSIDQPLNGISLRTVIAGGGSHRAVVGASHMYYGLLFYRDESSKLFFSRNLPDEVGNIEALAGLIEARDFPDRFLFDLSTDPGEQVNLAETEPERVAPLERRLVSFLRDTRIHIEGAGAYERTEAEIRAEQERLRALGYTQ